MSLNAPNDGENQEKQPKPNEARRRQSSDSIDLRLQHRKAAELRLKNFSGFGEVRSFQLEDFSNGQIRSPRPHCPPRQFVSAHPSKLRLNTDGTLAQPRSFRQFDHDGGASEWETVPDEDLRTNAAKALVRDAPRCKEIALVFHAEDILDAKNTKSIYKKTATLAAGHGRAKTELAKAESFYSSSSIYTDTGTTSSIDEARLLELDHPHRYQGHNPVPCTASGQDVKFRGEMPTRCSKTSSSSSADPFKYDCDEYSAFLQPSTDKDVNRIANPLAGAPDKKIVQNSSFYNHDALRSA